MLLDIQKFFKGIGYISKINNISSVEFRVSDINSLINIIIPHFKKYKLITNKNGDFILFEKIVKLMHEKQHRNIQGLTKILEYKAALNWGLSEKLKEAFPLIEPAIRSIQTNIENISPFWLAGFCSVARRARI